MSGMSFYQIVTLLLPVFLFSLAFHEMMHAVSAKWLGDTTAMEQGRISLNPFVHVDPFTTLVLPLTLALLGLPVFAAARPVMINPYNIKFGEFGSALIALAGPLTNLLLAFVSGLLITRVQSPYLVDLLAVSINVNVGLFVFNMIPYPPLDGSRLLYAFAPDVVRNVMDSIERMGLMGFAIFIMISYNFLSVIMGNLITSISHHLISF